MKVEMQKLEGSKILLEIEVPAEEVSKALDTAYRGLAKKVNIPGFRKGKVPKQILDLHIGKEAVKEEAFHLILPKAYYHALAEKEIEPVDKPEIELVKMEEGESLIFKATVQGLPEVTLGAYKDLGIKKELQAVTEENINKELEELQKKNSTMVTTERDTVEEGDTISLNFAGFLKGEAIEGGTAEGYSLEIGSKTFIPGFEEQLVGMKLGEEKEIEVTFPAEYHKEDLAGQDVIFKVKATEIKVQEIPALNDEFAKDVSEFATLDELKNSIKERLETEADQAAERDFLENLVKTVVENAQVDIPQVMIDQEVEEMEEHFKNKLQAQGFSFEQYKALAGVDEEKIKEQFKGDAEKRARTNLVLEAIAKAEDMQVGEAELDAEIELIAEAAGQDAKQIKTYLLSQGNLGNLKREIMRKKAIEYLKEQAEEK